MWRLGCLISILLLAACKLEAAPTELPVEQPDEATSQTPLAEAEIDRGVVAEGDGWAISSETLERHLSYLPAGTSRRDVLVELIDRRIIEIRARQLQVEASDEEVAAAAEAVGRSKGLTVAELEQEVEKQTQMSWEQYQEEMRAQMLEFKVMRMLGVNEATDEAFARVKQCLRASTEFEIVDPSIELAPNPYDLELTLTGLSFEGTLALDAKTLESAVLDDVPPGPACDVLLAVEPRLFQTYLEAGYLRAKIDVQWPEAPEAEMKLAVVVDAGAKHEVGSIAFDQTSVPAQRRLDEKSLRKVVAKALKSGDVAAATKLNEAGAQLNELLKTMSRPPAQMETNLVDDKPDVVNLTFVLVDG